MESPNEPSLIEQQIDPRRHRPCVPSITAVLAKYPGQVNLSYRDLPLRDLHPNAQMAAEASRCAAEQGKFWEYHDLLFAREADKQKREDLMEDARTLNCFVSRLCFCWEQDWRMPSSRLRPLRALRLRLSPHRPPAAPRRWS